MKNRKKPLAWMTTLLLCAIWLVPIGFAQTTFAPLASYAEAGMVIIASDTSAVVGDTMNVTVKYSASSLGLIDGELRYDPDMLKYVSGGTTADPSGGVIKLNKELKGETSQLFTIRFVAVGSGSDFFLVNTFQLKDGEGNDLGKPGASVKLIVSKPQTQSDPEDPVVAPDDPADNPTTDTPDTTEDPGTEEPAVDSDTVDDGTDDAANESADTKTPDTFWVLVGAIGVTTALLVLALIVVNRRRKAK